MSDCLSVSVFFPKIFMCVNVFFVLNNLIKTLSNNVATLKGHRKRSAGQHLG